MEPDRMLAVSERTREVGRGMGKELPQRVKEVTKSCGRKSDTDSGIKQKFREILENNENQQEYFLHIVI